MECSSQNRTASADSAPCCIQTRGILASAASRTNAKVAAGWRHEQGAADFGGDLRQALRAGLAVDTLGLGVDEMDSIAESAELLAHGVPESPTVSRYSCERQGFLRHEFIDRGFAGHGCPPDGCRRIHVRGPRGIPFARIGALPAGSVSTSLGATA